MPKRPARCGTRSGYNAHRRRGEEVCEECRTARRVARLGEADARRAYRRTLTRLAHLHPAKFQALKAEERAKEPDLRRKAAERAYKRALTRLARLFPAQADAIKAEERAREAERRRGRSPDGS